MPRVKSCGEYPPDWPEISEQVKQEAGYKCERCGHIHDPASGHTLTVHHLDGNKSNCARWNLAALCQKCHLHCQGKLFLPQFFMFEHSDWFKPHVEGYYRSIGLIFTAGRDGDYHQQPCIMLTKEAPGGKAEEPRAS